ncbi:MAG: putative O-glycosylation ligase, exosortase A system-associated, partial [Stellaceae bacterium]
LGPANTVVSDNNDIAAGLVVALPLMNYVRMNSARRWLRIAWLIVIACSIFAVLSTYSRGGLLGLVACVGWLWLKSSKKLVSGLAIGLIAVAAFGFMPEKYFARIETIVTYQQDESAMSRIEIWGAALKIALARPLTGGGYRVTQSQAVINRYDPGVRARDEHNVYIGVLADQGFIGLLIWLALPVVGWRNSRWLIRHARGRPEWRWAGDFARMSQVSIVAFFVAGSFLNIEYWDYYFTLIGLLAAIRHIVERAAVSKPADAAAALSSPLPIPS